MGFVPACALNLKKSRRTAIGPERTIYSAQVVRALGKEPQTMEGWACWAEGALDRVIDSDLIWFPKGSS
jgi:hypothetical protein